MLKKIIHYWYLLGLLLNKKNYQNRISSQNSDEGKFLKEFIKKIDNKTFLELGFHPMEFNTISLMTENYVGTIIDGNMKNVFFMKMLKLFHNYKIRPVYKFLNKNNIFEFTKSKFGIFSIDIDGNDYWILKEILNLNNNFELIIVEYNSSFLDKSITVPYDPNFNRHAKHNSGWYHGASLKAFVKLLKRYDYSLIKTVGGNNAFFIKKYQLSKFNFKELDHYEAFEECILRNKWSKTTALDQYETIKNLELIEV